MLPDDRFEDTQDLLRQPASRLAVTDRSTVVQDFRQDVGGVGVAVGNHIYWHQSAPGGAGEFRGGDRGLEGAAEELDRDRGRWGRPIDQERDDGSVLQALDDLDKREGVLADDERFDAPSSPGLLAQFGETAAGFGLGENEESDASLGEQPAANLPVPEMGRDQQHTLAATRERPGIFVAPAPVRKGDSFLDAPLSWRSRSVIFEEKLASNRRAATRAATRSLRWIGSRFASMTRSRLGRNAP